MPKPPLLADQMTGRENNIKGLRYLAALAVIVTHSHALAGDFAGDPLYRLLPQTNLGLLGVQVFFVLSGFLVSQSWDRRRHLGSFVVARALRIYPALVVAVLVTVVLAWRSAGVSFAQYFGDRATWSYVVQTAVGIDATQALPGAFPKNPLPSNANGSLWTLPVELRLYLLLGLFGVATALRSARAGVVTWAVFIALSALLSTRLPSLMLVADNVRGLAALFALGAIAYALRSRLPLSPWAAAAGLALYAANPANTLAGLAGLPLIGYGVLVAAYHPALRVGARFLRSRADYSYGMYVYAFPIQQTIAAAVPGISPHALLAAAIVPIAFAACISWHAIEHPALRIKPSRER